MKRLFIYLMCIFLCSCDPEWVFIPPYQSQWIFHNQTNTDLVLCVDFVCLNEWEQECEVKENYELLSGSTSSQILEGMYPEDTCFSSLFHLSFEIPLRGRIYLIPMDGGEALKEWVMGEENGAHDIFKEENWDYREWTDDRPKNYDILHREWTFTITDADIGVVE